MLPVGTAPFGNHSTGDFDDGFLRRKQRRNRTTFTLQQVMSLLRLSYFLRPKKKPKKSEFQRLFFVFSKTSTECVNQIDPAQGGRVLAGCPVSIIWKTPRASVYLCPRAALTCRAAFFIPKPSCPLRPPGLSWHLFLCLPLPTPAHHCPH